MSCKAGKSVRVTKLLLAGVTVFCVSWLACVGEWHGGTRWRGRRGEAVASTMKTIVAYSARKQAEMERPSPVFCDSLPASPPLTQFNRTWAPGAGAPMWQRVAGTRVALYAAFYDSRAPRHYVRILATIQGQHFAAEETIFCQMRAMHPNEDSVEVVAAEPVKMWWQDWDVNFTGVETPLLLSCPLREPFNHPAIVSIVTQPCEDPTNAFSLEPSHGKIKYKRAFTICVKDINFDKDISQNLVEWIEINKVLGVDMIDLYVDNVTEETKDILLHYQSTGFVRLFHVPIKYKPERKLWQRRKDHIITYNDCLNRNIYESEYIIPLDIDEIILPKIADTLPELVMRLKHHGWDSKKNSAILVQNVFFFDVMQSVQNHKHKKNFRSKSKFYIKRDDVRIRENENLVVDQIDIIEDTDSLSKEVIAIIDTDIKLYEDYKSRCGKKLPTPKLLKHLIRSAVVSPSGEYSKSLMLTKKVLIAFNHYPLVSLGNTDFFGRSAPFAEVQLNHYKESCNTTMVEECTRYRDSGRLDRSALRLRHRLMHALSGAICTPINAT